MLRKSLTNFLHYVKKIEAQAKNGFLIKKRELKIRNFNIKDSFSFWKNPF